LIIIVEGPDRVGKTTLVRALREYFIAKQPLKPVLVIGSAGINRSTPLQSFHSSYRYYDLMIALLLNQSDNFHIILDRFHLGEYVYAWKYRQYSGDYIFNLERAWVEAMPKKAFRDVRLILLFDSVANLMIREDGKSMACSNFEKEAELMDFHRAVDRSLLTTCSLDLEHLDVAGMIFAARGFIELNPEDF